MPESKLQKRKSFTLDEAIEWIYSVKLVSAKAKVAAEYFNYGSSRAVYNRMRYLGTTWSTEVDQAKKVTFEKLWHENPNKSCQYYCYEAGFSDGPAFSRALKRWYGVSWKYFKNNPDRYLNM